MDDLTMPGLPLLGDQKDVPSSTRIGWDGPFSISRGGKREGESKRQMTVTSSSTAQMFPADRASEGEAGKKLKHITLRAAGRNTETTPS